MIPAIPFNPARLSIKYRGRWVPLMVVTSISDDRPYGEAPYARIEGPLLLDRALRALLTLKGRHGGAINFKLRAQGCTWFYEAYSGATAVNVLNRGREGRMLSLMVYQIRKLKAA